MAPAAVANGHFDEDSTDPLSYYAQVLVEARTHAASSVQSRQHQGHASPTRLPPPSPGRHQAHQQDSPGGGHHKSWATRLLSFLTRSNKKRHEAKVIPVQQDATAKVRSSSKYKSAPLQQLGRQQRSGPLYTDGTPLTPSRRSMKPKSGPLAPFQLPDAADSPYVPLRRCTNSPRLYSGPVYLS